MSDTEYLKNKIKAIKVIFTILYPKFKKYLSKEEIEVLDKAFLELEK